MSTCSDFIRKVLSFEEFSFSWEELLQQTNASESTLRKDLSRLQKSGEILNLRKGFYIILPPRYQSFGKLPIELFSEKLFKYLKRPYYISLFSAALLHGAAHQQIQQDYVVINGLALRDIYKGNIGIRFFQTANWPENNILQLKSEAGYYKTSTPALTIADLINYQGQLGGLNRMLSIIEEVAEEIRLDDVADLMAWYPINSVVQRMGFLLEYVGIGSNIIDLLSQRLDMQEFYPVLLSPEVGRKAGKTGNRWKIDSNIELESDIT